MINKCLTSKGPTCCVVSRTVQMDQPGQSHSIKFKIYFFFTFPEVEGDKAWSGSAMWIWCTLKGGLMGCCHCFLSVLFDPTIRLGPIPVLHGCMHTHPFPFTSLSAFSHPLICKSGPSRYFFRLGPIYTQGLYLDGLPHPEKIFTTLFCLVI